jgi:hypothetical protein
MKANKKRAMQLAKKTVLVFKPQANSGNYTGLEDFTFTLDELPTITTERTSRIPTVSSCRAQITR